MPHTVWTRALFKSDDTQELTVERSEVGDEEDELKRCVKRAVTTSGHRDCLIASQFTSEYVCAGCALSIEGLESRPEE